MNTTIAAVVMSVATVVVLAGCSASPAHPAPAHPHPTTVLARLRAAGGTVNGSITVTDPNNIEASSQGNMPCSIIGGGFRDISQGTEVDVVDASGKVLGFDSLQAGTTPFDGACNFPFTIKHVPFGKKLYGVVISHRGALHYSEKDFFSGQSLYETLGG